MFFEVMDKEASLLEIWTESLVLGVGGFFLAKYRYWLLLPVLGVALLIAWGQTSELLDPFIGTAVIKEAGKTYVVQSCVAMAISLLGPTIGGIVGRQKRKRRAR